MGTFFKSLKMNRDEILNCINTNKQTLLLYNFCKEKLNNANNLTLKQFINIFENYLDFLILNNCYFDTEEFFSECCDKVLSYYYSKYNFITILDNKNNYIRTY